MSFKHYPVWDYVNLAVNDLPEGLRGNKDVALKLTISILNDAISMVRDYEWIKQVKPATEEEKDRIRKIMGMEKKNES